MKRILFICLFPIILGSCGVVKKKTSYGSRTTVHVPGGAEAAAVDEETSGPATSEEIPEFSKADAIVNTALTYTGTRYKYGGTSRKGMDCSGLLFVSFGQHDLSIPRVSHEMANQGKRIRVSELQKGDLLFFKTRKRGKKINHVGLVVEVSKGDVRFVHSTSSRGVIVSSLNEGFWNYAFVKATRVL